MSQDRITLTVPARGEYARTVRMTAAELAARLGMSLDEVDDVRIAAEEAFVYACECAGEDHQITFSFTVSDDALEAEVGPLPECCAPEVTHAVSEGLAEFILRSVCSEFVIEHSAGSCVMRLVCRRTAVEQTGA